MENKENPQIFEKDIELYSDMLYNYCMRYKNSHGVIYSCKFHVVWCSKYLRHVLVDGVDVRLKELIEETCRELQIDIIKIEILPEHVHLLVEVTPQLGIHKAVKNIKAKTSRILRQEYPWLKSRIPTLWTNSYFVSATGGNPAEGIKKFVESQKNT